MTVILRKIQGQYKIEATNSVITCGCLACGDKKSYIAFDGVSNEMIELRLETYRDAHSSVCPRLIKG